MSEMLQKVIWMMAKTASSVTYATWNPSDKSSSVSLSGGNLIATGNGAATNENFRSNIGKSSGKHYWEQKGANCAGVSNLSQSISDGAFPGNSIHSCSYNQSGDVYYAGSTIATVAGYVGTDIIGIAMDIPGNTITFYKNNTLVSVVNHTISGTLYAHSSVYGGVAGPNTAYFGPTLAYTPPSGFNAGLYT